MRALIVFCISFVLALALIPLANAQFCGDGACNAGEESWCSADCYCGNGACESGESSWCSADCPVTPAPFCGDGVCNSGESSWCSADCTAVTVNNPPVIAQFGLPSSASPNEMLSVPVSATDDDAFKVAELKLINITNPSKVIIMATFSCGNVASCSTTFTAPAPSGFSQSYAYQLNATDAAGLIASKTKIVTTTASPAPFCGDGVCNSGESSWCSADCVIPGFCGDGTCDAGESSWCSADCVSAPAPFCGDGVCNSGESSWCSADCVIPGFCGDGTCDAGESSWCSADCQVMPPSVNNPPSISFELPSFALPGTTISVSVTATDNDDYKVSRISLVDAGNVEIPGTAKSCGSIASCSATFSIIVPSAYSTSYAVRVNATDTAGKVSQLVKTASTARQCFIFFPDQLVNPGQVTFGGLPSAVSSQCSSGDGTAQCNPNGSWTVLGCASDGVSGGGSSCAPSWQCTLWSDPANSCGTRTCADANSCGTNAGKPAESASCIVPACTPVTSCSSLGCGATDSCGAFCGACPVPGDAFPSITAFSVPSAVDASASYTVTVTATDDNGVSSIGVFNSDGSVASPSQSCSGILSCTRSFIVKAPNAFDFVFHLVAKAFDTISQSVSSSSSGIKTNPEVPVVVPPVVPPEKVLDTVDVEVHSEALFVSGAIPDSSCLLPGSDSFMFVRMENKGPSALRDVKVTAYIPDLDLWSVSGPFSIGKGSSTSRFLPFSIPYTAPSGDYFIRIQATAGKDSVVKYRMFEVSQSC